MTCGTLLPASKLTKTQAYLLLGTNLGERQSNIDTALGLLGEALGRPFEKCSPVVETEAWGFEGPAFLNCAVLWEVEISAQELLAICKDIERRMGRRELLEFTPDGSRIYHDRIIDIDILYFGDSVISTPALTIPHPQVSTRPFVAELLKTL